MKKGILFDLDGTLWDSSKEVAASWNIVLEKLDLDYRVDLPMMHRMMGHTMDEIASMLFVHEEKERGIALLAMCTDYENEYLRKYGAPLYEGLAETLAILKKDHFLGIVSNCQAGYIEAFLDHHNLHVFFDDIECFGNNHLEKGANIRLMVQRNHLDQAVYVGDTMGDYMAARDAGISFIHAAYGFGTVPEGTPFIPTIRELPKALLLSATDIENE